MNNNLLQDIGENYEYIRTIVRNSVEIKKIEAAETASIVLGKVIFAIIASLLMVTVGFGAVAIGVIWLSSVLGSVILSISIFCGLLILLLAIVYMFRKVLVYDPCTSLIESLITFENLD